MKPLVRNASARRPMRAMIAALACGLLFGLSGCGIPALRKPMSAQTLPDTFNGQATAENSSEVPPIEFFNDPNLTSLINQALFGNQELRILAQSIFEASNDVMRRRGTYLPFVTFGTGASLEKLSTFTPPGAELLELNTPTGGMFPNPLPNFLIAADVTWQIDIWRQLRNARDAAGLRYLGTTDGWNYVVTRMVAEVAENYYKLMALDKQLETLDFTIRLQEQSLKVAKAQKIGARGNELGVQRFEAEVRKNQSEKWIIYQEIIQTENKINFLCGRFPQPVARQSAQFLDLQLQALNVGVPSQLLRNRPDIRQAERNLSAAGLDIRVARANFYPKVMLTTGVGYEAFNTRYLFYSPESLIYGVAGNLVMPLINKTAIRADYLDANAKQLEALYEYQRAILNGFTEVVNRMSKVRNYSQSIALKRQQLAALEKAVDVAGILFQNARIEYIDVLFAQRDRNDARIVLIDTKQEQLSAIVNAYQALGGGWRYVGPPMRLPPTGPEGPPLQLPPNLRPPAPKLEELPAPPNPVQPPPPPPPPPAR